VLIGATPEGRRVLSTLLSNRGNTAIWAVRTLPAKLSLPCVVLETMFSPQAAYRMVSRGEGMTVTNLFKRAHGAALQSVATIAYDNWGIQNNVVCAPFRC
jgi:hypothetical protein